MKKKALNELNLVKITSLNDKKYLLRTPRNSSSETDVGKLEIQTNLVIFFIPCK